MTLNLCKNRRPDRKNSLLARFAVLWQWVIVPPFNHCNKLTFEITSHSNWRPRNGTTDPEELTNSAQYLIIKNFSSTTSSKIRFFYLLGFYKALNIIFFLFSKSWFLKFTSENIMGWFEFLNWSRRVVETVPLGFGDSIPTQLFINFLTIIITQHFSLISD